VQKTVKLKKNDTSEATSLESHILIQQDANNNSVKNNDFETGGLYGRIQCTGFNNHIGSNTFHGNYIGWQEIGFVLSCEQSQENHVVALKKATTPHGFDLCN
jgi:hypothetical protein